MLLCDAKMKFVLESVKVNPSLASSCFVHSLVAITLPVISWKYASSSTDATPAMIEVAFIV